MSTDTTTIARPYAKAVFEFALANNSLKQWSDALSLMAAVTSHPLMASVINNPSIPAQQVVSVYEDVCQGTLDQFGLNFVRLLAESKRLSALLDIKSMYEVLRAEQEKVADVDVVSFSPLSEQQQSVMIEALKKRLNRDVTLNVSIDKALLGGAIIRAGDLVIDGSVRGKLKKLSSEIAA